MADEILNEDEKDIGLSSALDMFKEYKEVQYMIEQIPIICKESILAERGNETLKTILDQYQEQPHLLDAQLQSLLNQLISIIMDQNLCYEAVSIGFQYLWLIVKVRGYKTVARKMPHEVKDLLPILKLLEKEELENDFYGNYILLMWLSIVIYMPFNMTAFDASVQNTSENANTVVDRILIVIKKHLQCAQSSREMAAYLASRFVTRPDLREKYLQNFIDYCFEVLKNSKPHDPLSLFHKMGVLRALGLIFKHGKREELVSYAYVVLERFLSTDLNSLPDTPLRKYSMKLIQRIGLAFLRPKLASWRYQRGNRSLSSNIEGFETRASLSENVCSVEKEEEEDDVPAELEAVIDYLLQGLKDQDTVVRWSAAKGVGRVSERLPQYLADDVLGEILQQFSTRESHKSWHGGCLALAELARRGLLLPARLPDVMPILEKALVYDELKGQCSVGANIRDAACYLCWAFARAYHPDQLTTFVNRIATGLLVVSLFDREIPCRRAGSSAFQEHVGRQGNFPHGIEILTTVDYFAVGNRSHAYLDLSICVGQYPEYTEALINHLVNKKINHWDSAVRELAAKALHKLTPLYPDYVGKNILPGVVNMSVGPVLIARHGAILAAGHIVHGLFCKAQDEEGKTLSSYVENETLEKMYTIISTLESSKLFKGMGGEYMRQATSVLIEKLCLSEVSLEGRSELVDQWYSLLEECILNFEENIRSSALDALSALWSHYYAQDTEEKILWRQRTVDRYVQGLKCGRESQCLGYAALLGRMPIHLVKGNVLVIIEALIETSKVTPSTVKWALTRKQAVESMLQLVTKLEFRPDGDENDYICNSSLEKVYLAFLNALEDYTMDRRGDIGAWVRESSMHALQSTTELYIKNYGNDLPVFNPGIVTDMITKICQQSVERIDRTRKIAGSTFGTLLYSKLPNIPNMETVQEIFPLEWCSDCNWASESITYMKFVKLIDLQIYRPRILLGLTYSLGGVSANLSRYTLEALQTYLNERTDQTSLLLGFVETILKLFNANQRDDRVILPLIKSLSELLGSCSALDPILEQEEHLMPQLLSCLKRESIKCSDFHKLSATVTSLCEMLRIQSTCTKVIITQLTLFLGYQYPKVRAITATSFLTALLDYNDREIVPEEHLDEITAILEDTPWMDSMDKARSQRNRVCELVGVPAPQPKKAN